MPVLGGGADNYPDAADFLNEAQAAAFLGIPQKRLRKWAREGRVAFSKPTAKTVVYFRPDLIALLRATRVEATSTPPPPRSKPKTAAHRAAIAAGQAAAWERRRAERASGDHGTRPTPCTDGPELRS